MITQPSMGQLIRAVRARLADAVIPALSEETVIVEVQMMLSLLDTLAIRCEHEIAWMRDETAAIEAVASGLEGSPQLTAALAELVAADATSHHLADVARRYDRGGEVLSCIAEAAASNPALDETIHQLIRDRLAHEQEIVGAFSAVGRG